MSNRTPPIHSQSYTLMATFASARLPNPISAACTNPADIVNVRQQLLTQRAHTNFVAIATRMIRTERVLSLWNGVTASCLRELTYSTLRFGLNVAIRPSGLAPYANTFSAFYHVYQQRGGLVGGVTSLYRGVAPTMVSAAILTWSQIASYHELKTILKTSHMLHEGFTLHLTASMVAGLVCSVTSAPFDTLKVRLMQHKNREFSNAVDCVAKLVNNEGVVGLYNAFGMCCARLGSHTLISLILSVFGRRWLGV